jgi:L-rhamnose-H+ transport protein
MHTSPMAGIGFHAVGALLSSFCYTPQKRVRRWSWQTYWMTQAFFCWCLLPLLGAWLTIPGLRAVLAEAPCGPMAWSFFLGAVYGIGGTAFGLAIREIGFSLTYAIAIGLSAVLGTLLPPLARGEMGEIWTQNGSGWVIGGIGIGLLGIALSGWAGTRKEADLGSGAAGKDFHLGKGLLLSLLAGILSATYGFALEAGKPIAGVAAAHGAGDFAGNVVYLFANSGAFLTTLAYCLWLGLRHRTLGELTELPAGPEKAGLPLNFGMAALTGCLWYGQFFFYNLGHLRMGDYRFTSWGIHMILLVLFSNLVGVLFREWSGCSPGTRLLVKAGLGVLLASILSLTYGNYLHAEQP